MQDAAFAYSASSIPRGTKITTASGILFDRAGLKVGQLLQPFIIAVFNLATTATCDQSGHSAVPWQGALGLVVISVTSCTQLSDFLPDPCNSWM